MSSIRLLVLSLLLCLTLPAAEATDEVPALKFGFPKTYFIVDCDNRLTAIAAGDQLTVVDGQSYVGEETLPWFSRMMDSTARVWKQVSEADGTARINLVLTASGPPTADIEIGPAQSETFNNAVKTLLIAIIKEPACKLPRGIQSVKFQLTVSSDKAKLPRDAFLKLPHVYERGPDGGLITDAMRFPAGQPYHVAVLPASPKRTISDEMRTMGEKAEYLAFKSMSCRLINNERISEKAFKGTARDILKRVAEKWAPPKASRKDQVRLIAELAPNGTIVQVEAVTAAALRPSEIAALHAMKENAPFKPFNVAGEQRAWVCLDLSDAPRPDDEPDDF